MTKQALNLKGNFFSFNMRRIVSRSSRLGESQFSIFSTTPEHCSKGCRVNEPITVRHSNLSGKSCRQKKKMTGMGLD
jgi:hypothetical protein